MNKFLSAINFILAGALLGTILVSGWDWWLGVCISMNLASGILLLNND